MQYTGWRTICHTIDCTHNTFLLLQKRLTSGTELILIGWKIVPNEEHVQCDHRFVSQPLANEPLHSSQLFDTIFRKCATELHYVGPELPYIFWPNPIFQPIRINSVPDVKCFCNNKNVLCAQSMV